VTGKVVLVAPVYQGIDLASPLSMSTVTVFAIDGDKVAKPDFHARPLVSAASLLVPSELRVVTGHHYAFIAPFPEWLAKSEDIPVAEDPDGFDRSAFLTELNDRMVSVFADE